MIIRSTWNYGRKTMNFGGKTWRRVGKSVYDRKADADKEAAKYTSSTIVQGKHGDYYVYARGRKK